MMSVLKQKSRGLGHDSDNIFSIKEVNDINRHPTSSLPPVLSSHRCHKSG